MEFGNSSKNVIHTTHSTAFHIDNSKPVASVTVEYKRASDSEWHTLPTTCPAIYRTEKERVDFRVTFTANAAHMLKARIGASGCGAGGMSLSSPVPASWEAANSTTIQHWHQNHADNTYTLTLEYTLAAGSAAGTYTFTHTAWERAFNPAGGDGGVENDWFYDPATHWTHVPICFAVF